MNRKLLFTSGDVPPARPGVIWDEPLFRSPHPLVGVMMRNPHPPRGHVDLDCLVEEYGRAQCALIRETPVGYGFGAAALTAAEDLRARPMLSDGTTPSTGVRTEVTIYFPGPNE